MTPDELYDRFLSSLAKERKEGVVHRVHQQAAEAWLRGDAMPPGDGFEMMEEEPELCDWLPLVFRWLAYGLASWMIIIGLCVGFRWLWQGIAAGRLW